MSEIKEQLLAAGKNYVEVRIQKIHKAIDDLEAALKLETKCSMGDKYETGRAMLHLEFEKLSAQLEQYGKLKKTLNSINSHLKTEIIGFGSVVKTTAANYFIAIPAGEIEAGGEKFYAVGIGSPIAQALLGKKEGADFIFNRNNYNIFLVE